MGLCNLNEPLALFIMIQLQQLDCSVASLLPARQKSLYVRSSIPSQSERAACAFIMIQLQQLDCSVASLLPARQKSLYVRSSIPSQSERAACAFIMIQLQRLEQSVISLLHLRQKAPLVQEFGCPPVLNEPLALFIV